MALILTINAKHFGPNGLIPLRRGDDWKLAAQIQDKKGNYVDVKDLTSHSATAFFNSATGALPATVNITDAQCGNVEILLPSESTPSINLAPEGSSMYVILEDTAGNTTTVEPQFDVLEVKDRGFTT